jgi:hypothetical protein
MCFRTKGKRENITKAKGWGEGDLASLFPTFLIHSKRE